MQAIDAAELEVSLDILASIIFGSPQEDKPLGQDVDLDSSWIVLANPGMYGRPE